MKTSFNSFVTFLILITISYCSQGQDIHFSQFYDSPSTLNPATTGNFKGDYRASGIYRLQQRNYINPKDEYHENATIERKGFTTFNIAVDLPLYFKEHKFGVGIMMYDDKPASGYAKGVVNGVSTTKIVGSLSYLKKIKGHQISIGIQPAMTTKKGATSTDDLTGADNNLVAPTVVGAYNTGAIGRLLPGIIGEDALSSDGVNLRYFDLNIGGMWSKDFGKFEPTVGLAMFHVINPKESILGDDTRLPFRNVISFGGTYDLNEDFFLMPNVLFMSHKRVHDLVYGLNIGYNLDGVKLNDKIEFNYIYAGPQIRHSAVNVDALIFTAGANLKQWNIGISRDITLSNLKTGTNGDLGAWEVSIIYMKPETILKKKAIPCDRY